MQKYSSYKALISLPILCINELAKMRQRIVELEASEAERKQEEVVHGKQPQC